MAGFAIGGFGGVVVENSYVASQKFNTWLDEAERSRALGWNATVARDEAGHLTVSTDAVPAGAVVTAQLRRPLGSRETLALDFAPSAAAAGNYRSVVPVAAGRWTVRLSIVAGEARWAEELAIP